MRSSVVDCLKIKDGRVEIDLEKAKKHGSHRGIVSLKIDDKVDPSGAMSQSRSIQMQNPISAVSELNKMQDIYNKKINRGGAIVLIPSEDMNL
jgi:hypothetical protein